MKTLFLLALVLLAAAVCAAQDNPPYAHNNPVWIDGVQGQHAAEYTVHSDGKIVALRDAKTQSYLDDLGYTIAGVDYGIDATYIHVRKGRGVLGAEPTKETILKPLQTPVVPPKPPEPIRPPVVVAPHEPPVVVAPHEPVALVPQK